MLVRKNNLLLVLLFSVILAGCKDVALSDMKTANEIGTEEDFVHFVQEHIMKDYPDKTVKVAFAEYFSYPHWDYFETETGEHIVEFSGYSTYEEEEVLVQVQFVVDRNLENFKIGTLKFNDIPQNEATRLQLLANIYENHVSTAEAVTVEKEEQEITMPFQLGATLEELFTYYGEPSFHEYYLGSKLVVFKNEDGYFLDDQNKVSGFLITNPEISIYHTNIGMTPEEITDILTEPIESYFDDAETQTYIHTYDVGHYKLSFSTQEENGPTTSVIIMKK